MRPVRYVPCTPDPGRLVCTERHHVTGAVVNIGDVAEHVEKAFDGGWYVTWPSGSGVYLNDAEVAEVAEWRSE